VTERAPLLAGTRSGVGRTVLLQDREHGLGVLVVLGPAHPGDRQHPPLVNWTCLCDRHQGGIGEDAERGKPSVGGLLPPPFPLTPFILTCGALAVDRWRFFLTFGAMRLLRFGAEAVLARSYGRGVLRILQSDTFQVVIIGFVVLAVVGTVVSAVLLWRSTRTRRLRPA